MVLMLEKTVKLQVAQPRLQVRLLVFAKEICKRLIEATGICLQYEGFSADDSFVWCLIRNHHFRREYDSS